MANTQIYQVLEGRPYGRGIHGNATISGDPHVRRRGSASSGSKNLTLNASAYANGDLIIIHQTSGNMSVSNEDNWEINQIDSGGGTVNIVLKNNTSRSYSNAQILDVKEYINATINAFTITAWQKANFYGGLIAIASLGVGTFAGLINGNGNNGGVSSADQGGKPSAGGGFRGGGNSTDPSTAHKGEGWLNGDTPVVESQTTSDNGGGGGINAGAGKNAGGGGGSKNSGSQVGGNAGNAGNPAGNTTLTSLHLGGGGGGSHGVSGQNAGGGANGGASAIFWIRVLKTTSGGIQVKGGLGGQADGDADGGSGAGGSILVNTEVADFGTNAWQVTGGANATGNGDNSGSVGRMRINYGGKYSGSFSHTPSTARDPKLVATKGGAFLYNMV